MCRPRSIHRLSYFAAVPFGDVVAALCHAPERINGSTICLCEARAYRIDLPGESVRFTLSDVGPVTHIITQFKSCSAALWQRLKKLLRSLLPLRHQPSRPQRPPSAPEEPSTRRPHQSVAQVVAECQADPAMQGKLVFTDKAVQLADRCPFRHVEHVTEVLRKLSMAAGLMRGGLHRGMSQEEFWRIQVGLPVTFHLSSTQERKYGSDYDAVHDGRVLRGRMHVTLGSGDNPATCMSIHFVVCEDCQAIIITRCGKHGRTYHS